jgi:hypothetical protein
VEYHSIEHWVTTTDELSAVVVTHLLPKASVPLPHPLIFHFSSPAPFDVKGMRYIKYTSSDSGIRKLESQLTAMLRSILGLDVSGAEAYPSCAGQTK